MHHRPARWVGVSLVLGVAGVLSACSSGHSTGHVSTTSRCVVGHGSPSVTMVATIPRPTLTVARGSEFTVTTPAAQAPEHATRIGISAPDLLREICSAPLSDRGRIAVMKAVATGTTTLAAGITPWTETLMPSWGATIVVTQ
jgi:hypothetical protein